MESCKEIKIPLIKNKESIQEANIILLQQKISVLTEKIVSVENELVEVKKAVSKNDYLNKLNCLVLVLLFGLIIIYHR